MITPLYGALGPLGRAFAKVGSTLLQGLAHYWPLDELSGTRYDEVGDAHLTDNNTVGYALRGPVGTVASFVAANSEWLEGSPAWSGAAGTGFTMAAWVDGDADGQSFMGTGVHYGKRIIVASQNGIGGRFNVQQSGGGDPSVYGDFPIGLSRWHFVVWGVDPSTNKVFLSIDGSAKAVSTGVNTGQDLATGGFTWLGRDSTNIPNYYSGNMSRCGTWSTALDAATITSLFNSGNGKAYADLTAAEKVGLVSYRNLDETSGGRADSHGTNHLTDNNTVGSVVNAGGAMHNVAARFVSANSESLSIASGVPNLGGQFTVAVWWHPTAGDDLYTFLMAKGTLVYNQPYEFSVNLYNGRHPEFHVKNDSGGDVSILLGAQVDAEAWHLLVCWLDADKIPRMQVDGGEVKVGASALSGTPYSSAGGLVIGTHGGWTAYGGLADAALVWNRVLTADERAELLTKFHPFEE